MKKRTTLGVIGLTVLLSQSGCTFVPLTQEGEQVRLLTPPEISRCRALRTVTATTKATVGFIARGRRKVQDEVYRIAKNEAAKIQGDTIVPTGPMIEGEQTFNVYRCINTQ